MTPFGVDQYPVPKSISVLDVRELLISCKHVPASVTPVADIQFAPAAIMAGVGNWIFVLKLAMYELDAVPYIVALALPPIVKGEPSVATDPVAMPPPVEVEYPNEFKIVGSVDVFKEVVAFAPTWVTVMPFVPKTLVVEPEPPVEDAFT